MPDPSQNSIPAPDATNLNHPDPSPLLEADLDNEAEVNALREYLRQFDPEKMLAAIEAIWRKYLVCDQHLITLLTLWILHTWCFEHFPSTVYLNIHSPESQCGKTRCLELLHLFSRNSWLATGATPADVFAALQPNQQQAPPAENREEPQQPDISRPELATFLVDDCHHIFGPSPRQPLLALLVVGTHRSSCYVNGAVSFRYFSPKAFAGNARLPRSLAERSIPILLRRRKLSEEIGRLDMETPGAVSKELYLWIANWAYDSSATLLRLARHAPPQIPSGLTPHQQDCVEPLLHIADHLGGPWPEKARAAISFIFQADDSSDSIQVLSDIRNWFHFKQNAESLLTRDLLPLLINMEQRPWSRWTLKSGYKLAALLRPLGIFSHNITVGDEKNLKGYHFKDFADAWERYLPPLVVETPEATTGVAE